MKNKSVLFSILAGVVLAVIAVGIFIFGRDNALDPKSTQITTVNTQADELRARYDQALMRIDQLQGSLEFLHSDEAFDVEAADVSNLPADNSCSYADNRLLGSLNSGSDKFFYFVDNSKKINLSLLGLKNVNLGRNEKIGIMDYVEFKDTICMESGQKQNVRLAAGVRLELRIKESTNRVKAETPSKIAAAMELNLANVTYRIRTLGFKTDSTRKILADIEEQGDFNIKSYVG